MADKQSIQYQIGFADSEILSYHSSNDNLILRLKCWNEKIIEFEFVDCILFLILNNWKISDVCELNDSFLMERALKKVYETIPEQHPYKVFQFLDNDDDPAVEVACTNMIISVTS